MTELEINTAIAKACGWVEHIYSIAPGVTNSIWRGPDGQRGFSPPYYCNDLNEIHKAEKILKIDEWQTYGEWLRGLVSLACEDYRDAGGIIPIELAGPIWHATAKQRAEALFRTLEFRGK